ncbi:MAG: hypothetical protein AB1394_01150 [Bacteroidota bacterium]
MLTILATVLLSVVILTINRTFYHTNTTMAASRYNILAISVANSIIEDATGMRFDEVTSGAQTSTSVLTAPASLGIESGESAANRRTFDDFDDYNAYRTNPRLDTILVEGTNRRIIFNTICRVDYVTANAPNTTSSIRTWHKRLRLWVYCPEIRDPQTLVTDTIKVSTVFSYWYFR